MRRDESAVAPVFGVVVMLTVTILLSAAVFIVVSDRVASEDCRDATRFHSRAASDAAGENQTAFEYHDALANAYRRNVEVDVPCDGWEERKHPGGS